MRVVSALRAAGETHPGLHREVNEDRFHVDALRGLFMVVDGVGGQAAGGKAADTALQIMRARLERETGPVVDRVREAITAANNEIVRLGAMRAEWAGMACVLTVAVVENGRVVVGHVGDTRLYKIRQGRIAKLTRDHSPVGEREDAGEISELEAMRHPRRNEVYRDVGSERHDTGDADFIDIVEASFEPDAALLLCSDGLTDLVSSASINEVVGSLAGDPDAVAHALLAAANDAGGKDNVTVVYVEGEEFAPARERQPETGDGRTTAGSGDEPEDPPTRRRTVVRALLVAMLAAVLAAAAVQVRVPWPPIDATLRAVTATPGVLVVQPSDSIMTVVDQAPAGSDVVVEPGEYRERIRLKERVRIISRVPRGAIIRLPSDASEHDPAVVAEGVFGAELSGFSIVGDAATPLGTGLSIRSSSVTVIEVEITGAADVAIDITGASGGAIVGSDIHGNPGAGLRVRAGAATRISHSVFSRNGTSERTPASVVVDPGARVRFSRNVFQGVAPAAFAALDERARAALMRDNWFIAAEAGRSR